MSQTSADITIKNQILIIDDSHADVTHIVLMLENIAELDFDFLHVITKYELEMALSNQAWDIVLCDFSMPQLNPIQAIRMIQAKQPHTPIILLSGVATVHDAVDMMRLGARAFVEKSDHNRIITIVRQELETSQRIRKSEQIEATFRAQEARYQDIVDHQTELICRYDSDFKLTFVNRAYSEWRGLPPEALIGTVLLENIPEAIREQAITNVRNLTKNHPISITQHKILKESGDQPIIEWTDCAIFDEQDNIIEYQAIGRDVTQRITAEKLLQDQEANFRSLFNSIDDLLFVLDLQGTIQAVNQPVIERLGYPHEQLINQPIMTIHPEDHRIEIANILTEFSAGTRIYNLIPIRTRTGDRIPVETTFSQGTWNGEPALFMVTKDISERTIELENAKNRIEAIVNHSGDGILLLDTELAILQANRAFDRLLGITSDTYLGKTFASFFHPDRVASIKATCEQVIQQRKTHNIEAQAQHHNGDFFEVEINIAPANISDEEVVGLVCIVRDITDRKRIELEIEEKYQQERELRQYLETLHQVTLHLARVETLDAFYRSTVELGLKYFGFERVGLLLYDPVEGVAVGTYGTDANRNIVPEHHWRMKHTRLIEILQNAKENNNRIDYDPQAKLYDNENWLCIGENAIAPFYNETLSGWISIDNAIHHQPITQTQQDILGLFAFTTSVLLSRKLAEFALRDSESRYRLLAEHINDVIIKISPDFTTTYVTPSFYQLVGYMPEEMLGMPITPIIHPDDIALAKSIIENAIQSQLTYFTHTQRLKHKDGHHIWVEATTTAIYDPESATLIEFIGVLRDISERKIANEKLQHLSQRLNLATRAAGIGIWDWNLLTNDIFWDDRMFALYGIPEDNHPQSVDSWEYFVHPDDLPLLQATLDLITDPEITHEVEYRIILPDKTIRYVKANAIVIHTPEGLPERVIGVNMDITELKEAELTLRLTLEQEKELGDLKSRFVSMASHEFRTPLAAILATTETLVHYRDRMDETQIDARLEKIRKQVTHMKEIMEDVLHLARIQAGRMEFKPSEGDLDLLFQEIIEEFDSQMEYRGRIKYTTTQTPFIANFDTRLMRQIISNLISNALKYSPGGRAIVVDLDHDDHNIRFKVTDIGIGIPESELKHLFEPFHRAKNIGTISGTGLGLSIAKQAVDLHHGTITIDSHLAHGTTVIVTVPKVPLQTFMDL